MHPCLIASPVTAFLRRRPNLLFYIKTLLIRLIRRQKVFTEAPLYLPDSDISGGYWSFILGAKMKMPFKPGREALIFPGQSIGLRIFRRRLLFCRSLSGRSSEAE